MNDIKHFVIKRSPTLFLRLSAAVLCVLVATLCFFALPAIYREWADAYPEIAFMRFPVLIGLGMTAAAFFVAAHQAWKILGYIDRNNAFSESSVRALRNIKYCAAVIGSLYLLASPVLYHMSQRADAPGLLAIGQLIAFASFIVVVVIAVLQKLLQSAVDFKSENDLTV